MTLTRVAGTVTLRLGASPLLLFTWEVWFILPVGLHLGNLVASKRARIGSITLVLLPGRHIHLVITIVIMVLND